MRILVTGGAGFIGSHTVDALLEKGYGVRILDNLSKPVHLKGKPSYLSKAAEFMLGDVCNKSDWEKALVNVDAVYHLAAYQDYLTDFSKFFQVNSVGTALLYEIIVEKKLEIQKVIVASSQAVMGEGAYICPQCCGQTGDERLNEVLNKWQNAQVSNREDGWLNEWMDNWMENGLVAKIRQSANYGVIQYPNIRLEEQLQSGDWEHHCPQCGNILMPISSDENVIHPQNQYAMSKYTQEMIAQNLGRRYSIPTVCLRYSIVQGPRQSFYNAYSGACRIFSLNYFFDRTPVVYEDGGQIRDYVNIGDVVQANLLVLEKATADYQVFNVGGGKAYSVLEFAEVVRKEFDSDKRPRLPGEYRFGDTRHIFSDISRLKNQGWMPKYPIEKSVHDYAQYLRDQTDIEDILEYMERQMEKLGVVRKIQQ